MSYAQASVTSAVLIQWSLFAVDMAVECIAAVLGTVVLEACVVVPHS